MYKRIAIFCGVLWFLFSFSAHAQLVDSKSNNGIVYLLDNASTEIKRYSFASSSFLSPISLTALPIAFHVDGAGLYVSYGTTTVHLNLDGTSETTLRITSKTISDIESLDDILILASNRYLQTINKNTGLFIDESDLWYTSSQISIDAAGRNVFMRSSGISPSDINRVPVDTAGNIGVLSDSPYHGDYPGGSKTFVFPTQNRVVDTSGTIYSSLDLTYSASLGGAFTDISFWNGLPVVLKNGTLYAYNQAILQTGFYDLTMTTSAYVYVSGDNVFVFSNDQATVEIVNISLLSPADPVAPIDPTGLTYVPDSHILDADNDTVYLLSKSHLNIFRWSITQQKYLSSIPLANPPQHISYSPEHNRIYASYANGVLNYIDLTDFSDHVFASLPSAINTIASIGDFVFARDNSGAWGTFSTYDINGVRKEAKDWSYPTSNVVFNSVLNRIYYISGYSPSDLHWQPVDPVSGLLGSDHDSPFHNSTGWQNPINISQNGKYIVLGSGRVVDAEIMNELGYTSQNNNKDVVWLHGNVFSLRSIDSNTYSLLERWEADFENHGVSTYQLLSQPLGLIPLRNISSLLIIYSVSGIPQFEVRYFDAIDSDGDSYVDTVDALPADPTEWYDFDNDGVGDNADTDDDNDGVLDTADPFPFDATEWEDTDNDLTGDNADTDDDNDGVLDINDALPKDPTESVDTDNDGIGNNADTNDDNDASPDNIDPFPLDATEWLDTDSDGTGDNSDLDDDNDGVPDISDYFPTDETRHELDLTAFLPLNPGSTWHYSTTGSDPVILGAPITVAGQKITPMKFPFGSNLYLKVLNNQIYFYGVYLPRVSTPYGTFSTDMRLNTGVPLVVNGNASGTATVTILPSYGNRSMSWSATTLYLGKENITVASNTYETIKAKINFTGTANVDGANVSVVYTTIFWFAENTGIVNMQESGITSSLTQFKITDNPIDESIVSGDEGGSGSLNVVYLLVIMISILLRFKIKERAGHKKSGLGIMLNQNEISN